MPPFSAKREDTCSECTNSLSPKLNESFQNRKKQLIAEMCMCSSDQPRTEFLLASSEVSDFDMISMCT